MRTQEAVMKRIEKLCGENHISINRLAHISGVSPSTVKNIINGNSSNTGVVTIAKICNGLNISVTDFFYDEIFCDLERELE